jgi:hypothetical protein
MTELLLKGGNCSRLTVIRLTTRCARGTEVTEGNDLLMCRETTAHQNHHGCGAVVFSEPCPKGEGSWPIDIPRSAKSTRLLCVSVSLWFAKCKR